MKRSEKEKKENALLRVKIGKIRTTVLFIKHRFAFRGSRKKDRDMIETAFLFFLLRRIEPSSILTASRDAHALNP